VIEVPATVQLQPGVRYVFEEWDDGVSSVRRTVTVSAPIRIAALYRTEYLLSVVSTCGTPSGEGWYEAGTSASISVSPDRLDMDFFTEWKFEGWSSEGSTVSTDNPYVFLVSRPVVLEAIWKAEPIYTGVALIAGFVAVSGGLALVTTLEIMRRGRKKKAIDFKVRDSREQIMKYEQYLAKLEEEKSRGTVSERAYELLRDEYQANIARLGEENEQSRRS